MDACDEARGAASRMMELIERRTDDVVAERLERSLGGRLPRMDRRAANEDASDLDEVHAERQRLVERTADERRDARISFERAKPSSRERLFADDRRPVVEDGEG